jgi:DNA-binding transcriptional regulator YhcF (GntR family)
MASEKTVNAWCKEKGVSRNTINRRFKEFRNMGLIITDCADLYEFKKDAVRNWREMNKSMKEALIASQTVSINISLKMEFKDRNDFSAIEETVALLRNLCSKASAEPDISISPRKRRYSPTKYNTLDS